MQAIDKSTIPAFAHVFVPDFRAQRVEDINFGRLAEHGVRALALDADSTITPFGGVEVAESIFSAIARARRDRYIDQVCIATNRRSNNLHHIAERMEAVTVVHAQGLCRKPNASFFERVTGELGLRAAEIVMVGDTLLSDIVGGNRSGLKTLLVSKLRK